MKGHNLHDTLREVTIRFTRFLEKSQGGQRSARQDDVDSFVESPKPALFPVGPEPAFNGGLVFGMFLFEFLDQPTTVPLIDELLRNYKVIRLLRDMGVDLVPGAVKHNILQPLLTRQLIAQKGVRFDVRIFESNYRALEEYLDGNTNRYLLTAPLANFRMETDVEQVGIVIIRRLTQDEFMAYNGLNGIGPFGQLDPRTQPMEFALEIEETVKRGRPPLTQVHRDMFWWFVAALKLIKADATGYETIWCSPLSWTGMSFGTGSALHRLLILGKPYVLKTQDLAILRRYWRPLEQCAQKNAVFWRTAMERYCDAVDRARSDEALIDYWVACESLFGEDVGTGELSYRLSLRIAHFLEKEPSKREAVRKAVKDAYRGRSLLLHGSKSIEPSKLQAQTQVMKEITRRSLCLCIESKFSSHDEMIRRIEQSIIGTPNLKSRAVRDSLAPSETST